MCGILHTGSSAYAHVDGWNWEGNRVDPVGIAHLLLSFREFIHEHTAHIIFSSDTSSEGSPRPRMCLSSLAKIAPSVASQSVKNNTQVLINVRNNHKLLARIKAFDRHCNMCVRVHRSNLISEDASQYLRCQTAVDFHTPVAQRGSV